MSTTAPCHVGDIRQWHEITIPRLRVPFPVERNIATEWAGERAARFVRSAGLVTGTAAEGRHDTARLGSLMGSAYPTADAEALALVTEWISVNLVLDDHFDRTDRGRDPGWARRTAAGVLAQLPPDGRPRETPRDAITAAYADLWRRTAAPRSPRWRRRFVTHVAGFLEVCAAEAANRRDGRIPGSAEYRDLRGRALHPYLDLIEVTTGNEIPDGDPSLRALHAAVSDADLWTNDLFSCVQEAEFGDPHNLVIVEAHHRGVTPAEAVRVVAGMVQERIDDVVTLAADVEQAGVDGMAPSAVAEHVRALRAWVSGQLAWRYETRRFDPADGPGR